MTGDTLVRQFQDTVRRHGNRAALKSKTGEGVWRTITYDGFGRYVRDAACGLMALGVAPGDRVALWSANRPEWAITDYAALHAGAVTVPLYDTLNAEQAAYIINDAGAKVLLVDTEEKRAEVERVMKKLRTVEKVVAFEGGGDKEADLLGFDELLSLGETHHRDHPDAFESAWQAVAPGDLASLIYTSGTTGAPKGVCLTHENFASNVNAALEVLPLTHEDTSLSFLPLSHSFERTGGHFTLVAAGATIAYAESIDTVADNMVEVQPTVVLSVPRLYEKMYAKILAGVEEGGAAKQRIFDWAIGVGGEWVEHEMAGRAPSLLLKQKYKLADKLVFSKLKERTGGRLRFFVSGGAAISRHLEEFFAAAGLWILGGYGLTETSPVVSVNTFDHARFGSVGRPIPGVEVRLGEQDEIQVRGPNVMQGYYNLPEESKACFTEDGWFRTGDAGRIDNDGFIYITDRIKEILVMSNGKNVAPQPIEGALKKASTLVAQAVLIGDDRKFISALIAPNFEELEKWAADRGVSYADRGDLVSKPEVVEAFQAAVDAVNRDLSRYQQVKTFRLLPRELTQEDGELTPTLKVKRRVVDDKWKRLIDEMYPAH